MSVPGTIESGGTDDLRLIAASLAGDREAFGRIVARYQGLITGLIYAGCGDLHRSEDLAQETFVAAWQSLAHLNDPSKLSAWLCQIARHLMLDHFRKSRREQRHREEVVQTGQTFEQPAPDSELIAEESSQKLWNTISHIPQPYRDTLVLFYRQNQSTAAVAEAMETTEAAVRTRLTRGRQMLREKIAAQVERELERTAPSPAFTLGVVAALPAIVPQSIKAATIGAAIKGSAGTGFLMNLAIWAGPLAGIAGGIYGARASYKSAETPRERRFFLRQTIVLSLAISAALAVLFELSHLRRWHHWSVEFYVAVQAAFWVCFCLGFGFYVITLNRRHRLLRAEEGLSNSSPPAGDESMSRGALAGTIFGGTAGATAWMFNLSLQAGDYRAAGLLCLVVNLLIAAAFYFMPGRPRRRQLKYLASHTLMLGALNIAVIYLRLHQWMAITNHTTLDDTWRRLPPAMMGTILLLIVIICAIAATALARRTSKRRL